MATNYADMLLGGGALTPQPAPQPAPPPQRDYVDMLLGGGVPEQPAEPAGARGLFSSAMQGLTFGFADEIRGLAQQAAYGIPYAETVQRERDLLSRTRAESPWLSMGAEMAGAVVPGMAAAPLAVGRGLASAALRGAGLGAAEGAVYGAGTGEDLEGRALGAAGGAVVGGGLGAAIPAGAELVRRGWQGIAGAASPQTAARRQLQQAMMRDDLTARQFAAEAAEAGRVRPGVAMLGDVGGENVAGLVERVVQSPGAGRSVLVPRLSKRLQSMRSRLTKDLTALTGGDRKSALSFVDDVMERRATASAPLYQRAYAADISEAVPDLRQIMDTPDGRKAWAYARRIASNEDGINLPTDLDELELNTRLVDYWKRGLDQVIDSHTTTDLGRTQVDQVGRSVLTLKNRALKLIDKANPDYRRARQAWASDAAFIKATSTGRSYIKHGHSAEEMRRELVKLSEAEVEAFRIGAVSELIDQMERNSAKAADFTKLFRSQAMREKIEALMPDKAMASNWLAKLDFEINAAARTNQALGNSATARRLAEMHQGRLRDTAMGLAADLLTHGTPGWGTVAGAMGGQKVRQTVGDTVQSRTDRALAMILAEPVGSPRARQIMRQLATMPDLGLSSRAGGALIAPAVAGVIGGG